MRKARLFKLFTTFIIVLMLGTLLCACEMFGGGSTANNNGTGNENKSEAKPALNTVFASYDKVEEKGSVATMDRVFKNAVLNVGLSVEDTSAMMSRTPAILMGAGDYKGVLDVGYDADFLFIDENCDVERVFVRGKCKK